MYRYFLWCKRAGNIVKNFAILRVRASDPLVGLIVSDGSSPTLWVLLGVRLLQRYFSIFPRLWSDDGHLNMFWIDNIITAEIDESELVNWRTRLPIFDVPLTAV